MFERLRIGRLAALLGTLALLSNVNAQSTLLEIQGSPTYASSIACAGDVNSDGVPDLALADDIVGTIEIRSGFDGTLIRSLTMDALGQSFGNLPGYAMAELGDVDGDGKDDLLVAQVGEALAGLIGFVPIGPGVARIVSGANGATLSTLSNLAAEHSFGFEAINCGDIDLDGIADAVVGAPWASTNGLFENGFLRFFSGANGAVIHTVHGNSSLERFGQSMATAGDWDGDMRPDIVVGSNLTGGSARIVSGFDGSFLATLTAGTTNPSPAFGLGYAETEVAGGADVDGDGVLDVALGKRGGNLGGFRSGEVFVFSGASGQVVRTLVGDPCDGIGAVVLLVDVNQDSMADVIVSSRNDAGHDDDVTVFSGDTGDVGFDTDPITNDMTQMAVAGDVDGDGVVDLLGSTDPSGQNPGQVLVISGGPWIGPAGQGVVADAGNQAEDILFVNGSEGRGARHISVDKTEPLFFEMQQPSVNSSPAGFLVFGRLGAPAESHVVNLPSQIGDFAIRPAALHPFDGLLFTLASSLGPMPGGEVLPAFAAPWSYLVPALNIEATFTLQAVVETAPGVLKPTNAIIVTMR
ncbi:MAG: hypothetical protein V3W41_16025 [Planctomycetota bacterium]